MDAMSKWDHLEPSSHQVAAPKRSFSQASLPVAAAAQSASSSKAEASSSSKVNPYELYGVSPPSKRRAMKSQVFAVDYSSQEGNAPPVADMKVAPEHENGDTAAVLLQFFDQEKGVKPNVFLGTKAFCCTNLAMRSSVSQILPTWHCTLFPNR